mmetsp:Transcript_39687/g.66610  ORF Transcript_39687/g.66610 Transcript_39687/m.66610 type:complete len:117 (+) Transcript_39687:248-598(+)
MAGHVETYAGHVETVKVLVEEFGRSVLFAQDKEGCTPLHGAAFFGHTETVRELVEKGGDVEARAREGVARGYTPLDMAAACGHGETARDGNGGRRPCTGSLRTHAAASGCSRPWSR